MRVTSSPQRHARKKKWIKLAKGYVGHKHIAYKMAKQQTIRSWKFSFDARKNLKSDFRMLWIARINAAVRAKGVNYSSFMNAMAKNNINLNRKMLSEIAIRDPKLFDQLIEIAKKPVPGSSKTRDQIAAKPLVNGKVRPKMYAETKAKQTSRRGNIAKDYAKRVAARSMKNK